MKINSRKLWAYLIWSALIIFSAIKSSITPELITWYGAVTCIYIGGQSFVDARSIIKKENE